MTARLFFDTNILVYALDRGERQKRDAARDWLRAARAANVLMLSPQVLNESYLAIRRRFPKMPRAHSERFLRSMFVFCRAPTNLETTERAWRIEQETRYAWWDCLLLASASQSGCRYFVSEDLHDGQVVGGLTITNPFAILPSALIPV